MKKQIVLTLLLSLSCANAQDLNSRLWRELEKSKHEIKVSAATEDEMNAQDLSWLEDANQTSDETVDEVMAEFNRTPAPASDSISLKMSGLKKPEAAITKKENSRSPAIIQNQGDDYSMTRGRSR